MCVCVCVCVCVCPMLRNDLDCMRVRDVAELRRGKCGGIPIYRVFSGGLCGYEDDDGVVGGGEF